MSIFTKHRRPVVDFVAADVCAVHSNFSNSIRLLEFRIQHAEVSISKQKDIALSTFRLILRAIRMKLAYKQTLPQNQPIRKEEGFLKGQEAM